MKAFRLIGMALVAMCLCMNFASCSNEDVLAPEDPQGEKYATVGLGCTGEFLEFSDSPMGRAATDELYGIQVYALTQTGSHFNESTGQEEIYYEETPYAYGMFTALEDVKIRLLEGHKYKFEVSIVIDPFKKSNDHYTLANYWFGKEYYEFNNTYGTEFFYTSIAKINTKNVNWYDSNNERVTQYDHDRYYGELDVYTPQENGSVEINTKRVAYGVKYITTGLADGESLKVEVRRNEYSSLYAVNLNTETNEGIYTFYDIDGAWRGLSKWNENTQEYEYVNYTSDKKLTISWNKPDGSVIPMGTYAVTFKRNVMTTIKINAENLNTENGIKVYKEEVSMADDENIYEITGGTVTEVPVIPGN